MQEAYINGFWDEQMFFYPKFFQLDFQDKSVAGTRVDDGNYPGEQGVCFFRSESS